MDRFREISTFVAIVEEGSFSGAARRLHTSPPAVTRLVNALEARLGVQLLNRTTRQVKLTEAGVQFLGDAQRILEELGEAENRARGANGAPGGVLKITAPEIFGRVFVGPILCDYLSENRGVTAEALFVDRSVDLIGEGMDVAVRIGELRDSSLTATNVGMVRRVTVASPDYLARHDAPETPDELASHRVIHPTGISAAPSWHYTAGRRRRKVQLKPALSVNTSEAAISAAVSGFGITRVLSFEVSGAMAEGKLVEVLKEHEDGEMPVHLLHPEGRNAASKIRVFMDMAAPRLRAQADRISAR